MARYPVGSPVAVRHHPQRPADAVPEVRSAGAKHLLITGLIFFSVGIVIDLFLLTIAAAL